MAVDLFGVVVRAAPWSVAADARAYTNVRAHGARADGTTDDRAAIQAAIASVAAQGGGIVEFPAGIYKVELTPGQVYCVRVNVPTIRLVGAGRGVTTILCDDAAVAVLFDAGGDGGSIESLTIEATGAMTNPAALKVDGCTDVVVTDIEIAASDTHGIHAVAASRLRITGCDVHGTGDHAILLEGVDGAVVSGCHLHDTTSGGSGVVVALGSARSEAVVVSGNNLHDLDGSGVTLDDADRCAVVGNTIATTVDDGVALSGATGCSTCTVVGNTIEGSGERGVAVVAGTGFVVAHNTIDTTKLLGIGIETKATLDNVADVIIDSNIIIDGGSTTETGPITGHVFGISVRTEGGGFTIDNVAITNNTIDGYRNSGVSTGIGTAGGAISRVAITGNRVSGTVTLTTAGLTTPPSAYPGIHVQDVAQVRVLANVIKDCEQQGIFVRSTCSGEVRVSHNTCDSVNRDTLNLTTHVNRYAIEIESQTGWIELVANSVAGTMTYLLGAFRTPAISVTSLVYGNYAAGLSRPADQSAITPATNLYSWHNLQ